MNPKTRNMALVLGLLLISLVPILVVYTRFLFVKTTEPAFLGMCVHGLNSNDYDAIQELGVTWVRNDVDGLGWEETILCAQNTDLKVLGILDHQTMNHDPNFTLEDWKNNVTVAVQNYAEYVDAWEIWNEPQSSVFQYGYQDGSAEHYFNMLKEAYQIIKTYDSSAPVLGLGGAFVYGPNIVYDLPFVTNVMLSGGGNYMDVISVHVYLGTDVYPEASYPGSIPYYKTFGKELWVTEFGASSQEGDQTEYLRGAAQFFDYYDLDKTFCYILRDNNQFGLLDETGEKKPSFFTYKQEFTQR